MGITIHFEGTLRSERSLDEVISVALAFAGALNWPSEMVDSREVHLDRMHDEESREYVGPVRGVVLYPHADCEAVRLEFDNNLFVQDYAKTQFAGPEVHAWVVGLLRRIRPLFETLEVTDEGEYWESDDMPRLKAMIDGCNEAIRKMLQEHPTASVKVRTPDGKIIDLMT